MYCQLGVEEVCNPEWGSGWEAHVALRAGHLVVGITASESAYVAPPRVELRMKVADLAHGSFRRAGSPSQRELRVRGGRLDHVATLVVQQFGRSPALISIELGLSISCTVSFES